MKSTPVDQSRNISYRNIIFNGRKSRQRKISDNQVSIKLYKPHYFLALALWAELTRPSNIWLLVMTAIQVFSNFSEKYFIYITSVPLMTTILISLIKNGIHTYLKYKADNLINTTPTKVWDGNAFVEINTSDLTPGDFVMLSDLEKVPADMIIFCVGSQNNKCFVDSSNILDEKNLIVKTPVQSIKFQLDFENINEVTYKLKHIKGVVTVPVPNSEFSDFDGKIKLKSFVSASKLRLKNLLLRDSKVINVDWVIGLVIYTGNETKAWMNAEALSNKKSLTEKFLDKCTIAACGVVVFISIVSTILSIYASQTPSFGNPWETFLHFLLIFGVLIPAPAYLILDITRILQVYNIQKTCGIGFRNTSILEDLGKVEYIITDKSGTLSQTQTKVRMCLLNTKYCKNLEDIIEKDDFTGEGVETGDPNACVNKDYERDHFIMSLAVCNKAYTNDYGETYLTKSCDEKLLINSATNLGVKLVNRTKKNLAVVKDEVEISFNILGCQSMSKDRKKSHIIIQSQDKIKNYLYVIGDIEAMDELLDFKTQPPELLEVINFNKYEGLRQLVVAYKELNKSETCAFANAYIEAKKSPVNKNGRIESLFEEIDENSIYLGLIGLEEAVDLDKREAVIALKHAGIKIWMVTGDSFENSFSTGLNSGIVDDTIQVVRLLNIGSEEEFKQASESILEKMILMDPGNRSKTLAIRSVTIFSEPMSLKSIDKSISGINTNRLSINTIKDRDYNKQDSNVVSVEDLKENSYSISLSNRELQQRAKNIHPWVSKLTNTKSYSSIMSFLKISPDFSKYNLFIDSNSLDLAIKSKENMKYLVVLLFCANSVCFTSLLPAHKTKVARILKHNFSFNPVFIAVGDSGSDAGMIREAHIGVGVGHKEITQAVIASDIVINDFSDLKALILQKGFISKYNIKKSLNLGFYMVSMIFTLILLLNFITDYSGALFIPEEWYITYYLLYPITGIICIGAYDNQISMQEIENNLKLYTSQALESKNISKFGFYIGLGVIHSCVIIFIFQYTHLNQYDNILTDSLLLYLSIILSLNMVCYLATKSFNKITTTLPIINTLGCIIMITIQSYNSSTSEVFGLIQIMNQSSIQILHLCMGILFQLVISSFFFIWQQIFMPTIFDCFRNDSNLRLKSLVSKRLQEFKNDLVSVFKYVETNSNYEVATTNYFSPFTLKYSSCIREKNYQSSILKQRLKQYKIFLIFSILLGFLLIIGQIAESNILIRFIVVQVIMILFSLVILILLNRKRSDKTTLILLKIIYIVYQISVVFSYIFADFGSTLPITSMLYILIYFFFITEDWMVMVIANTIGTIFIIVNVLSNYKITLSYFDYKVACVQFIVLYFSSGLALVIITYKLKAYDLNQFNLLKSVEEDHEKVNSVLDYLLPTFVRKRVKNGVRYIADDQAEVSVLFCYILDFEKIVAEYSIEELTGFLDELFRKIDSLCELIGVSKIETVGNTYMACAGLKDSDFELKPGLRIIPHARRCIELGFAILKAASQMSLKSGEKISLKIGVNSGAVTAGVVGFHKPQFSLVGDTVNTASRMASTAKKNTIRISKQTYNLLEDSKNFSSKLENIYIKGKDRMETYIIEMTQLKSSVENSIENRISMSYSSINAISGFVYENENENEDIIENDRRDFLKELQIHKTSDYFGPEDDKVSKIQLFTNWCKHNKKEKEFRDLFQTSNFWIYVSGMTLRIIVSVCMVATLAYSPLDPFSIYLVCIYCIEVIFLSLGLLSIKELYANRYFYLFLTCIYTFGLVTNAIEYLNTSLTPELVGMKVLFHFQLISHCSGLLFSETFLLQLLLFAFWGCIIFIKTYESFDLAKYFIISIVFISIIEYTMYNREKNLRKYMNLSIIAKKDSEKTEKLLTQMIPPHVYKHLKEENTFTDIFFQVTVIYADIVGFTSWSNGRDSREIVNMLSMLFTKFDENCVKHNVYKVHTIGDCYVAMSYHGNNFRNPIKECENMVEFAYSMIDVIQEANKQHKDLNMRIGLHTGDVIGGVMGTSIVRYDIYGTDVLVANQIESNGIPGKVVVSETTKEFLEQTHSKNYSYKFHTEVCALTRSYKAFILEKNT